MTETTSSAKHLYSILKKAWDDNTGQQSCKVWSKVFDTDESDEQLSSKIVELISLINRSKDDIRKLRVDSDEKDSYLSALSEIEVFIVRQDLAGGTNWNTLKGNTSIDKKTLSLINSAGRVMILEGVEQIVFTPQILKDLQEKVEKAIQTVVDSDIESKIKRVIVNELLDIQEAINAYDVQGSSRIQDASNKALGSLFKFLTEIRNNTFEKVSDKAQETVEKALFTVLGIAISVTTQSGFDALPDSYKEIIKSLPKASVVLEDASGNSENATNKHQDIKKQK